MYARVSRVHILPGKLEEFCSAVDSVIPRAREQQGFRALIVLRNADPAKTAEATVISVWDSLEHLKDSERNLYLYQAISRILGCCEGFPQISEQEVLVSEFDPHRTNVAG
jgi:heme-degrading monooxygenase HmoA